MARQPAALVRVIERIILASSPAMADLIALVDVHDCSTLGKVQQEHVASAPFDEGADGGAIVSR